MTPKLTIHFTFRELVSIGLILSLPFWGTLACRHTAGSPPTTKQRAPLSMNAAESTLPQAPPEIKESLKTFVDVYAIIERDYIASLTFPDYVENSLKGLETFLGKDRLSYTRTVHSLSISCSGEEITINDTSDGSERMKEFVRLFRLVERTNPQHTLSAIVYAATKGVAAVDSHSSFMSPDEYKLRQEETMGRFESIGVVMRIEDGVPMVVSSIDAGPAFKTGILGGDKIVMIDGTPTKGLTLMESVNRLRGARGTPVTITVVRNGLPTPRDFTIIRDTLPDVPDVHCELLEKDYGYIRISRFSENTDLNFTKGLKSLEQESKAQMKGIILDLRNNPGGLLNQVVKVADMFIESGLILSVEGRREDQRMKFYAHKQGTMPSYPLLVLVNHGTASGSEMVAGALQDHRRALILGTRTFGNGTVQTIFPFRDRSGLRLTTAVGTTPQGNQIEKKGTLPDLIVISKKDKSFSSQSADHPKIVIDSNEKEVLVRIATEILRRTSSHNIEDLMLAAKEVSDIVETSGVPGDK